MKMKYYWPQIESPVAMVNSITTRYVVEGKRIIKATIAEFDRKMEENSNAERYISNEASS